MKMDSVKARIVVAVFLLVFILVVVWLSLFIGRNRGGLPKFISNSQSFGDLTRVGGTEWEVGELWVNYKKIGIGGNVVFIEGSYVDQDNETREVQVFFGNLNESGEVELVSWIYTNDLIRLYPDGLVGLDELQGVFDVDDRLRVDFMITATNYDSISGTEVCTRMKDICTLAARTKSYESYYSSFWYEDNPITAGVLLNAIRLILPK